MRKRKRIKKKNKVKKNKVKKKQMKFKNRMTMCLLECIQNLSHLVIKTYKRTIKIYLLKRGLKSNKRIRNQKKRM